VEFSFRGAFLVDDVSSGMGRQRYGLFRFKIVCTDLFFASNLIFFPWLPDRSERFAMDCFLGLIAGRKLKRRPIDSALAL
jgi:hypothetical protein